MNEPHDPNRTVEVPSTPADSLDGGLAAGFGPPRSSLGDLRPVLLKEAEGNSAHVVKPKSDAMPSPEQIGDRYQLQGEIARGGMGAVLRGRDVDLGRDLAVKVLLEKYVDRPEVARRFIEEAQIGGQLQHPGVVPVYDIGCFGNRPFFTMKLVKGHTLAALLAERTDHSTDRPRFLAIALQVAQAVAYAHAKGVIHRDLKPANVMVGAFGEVQVMDWGLAKVLAEGGLASEDRQSRERRRADDASLIRTARSTGLAGTCGTQTEAGSLLGTPAYMPPEQANGDIANLDRRADVFGMGAILCEVLTGKPPYIGRSAEEVRRQAANGNLADARARLDACGADPELITLTKACLSPEAIDRPRDAQAVADGLTAYLDGVQERLRQAELAEAEAKARAIEEVKRRRLALALAATVLLAVTLGGGGFLYVKNERDVRQGQLTRDVNDALNQATALREKARTATTGGAALFAQAREQAQRALALIDKGPADQALVDQVRRLQIELDEEEKDRKLVAALDEARLAQATFKGGENRFATEEAVPRFREAFRDYGLPAGEGTPAATAQRIRRRPAEIRAAIVAALDDWDTLVALRELRIIEPDLEWLRAVLAAAEPDDPWARRLRAARAEKDHARRARALEKLAATADVAKVPARALTRLADLLGPAPRVKLLRRAQAQYPADFLLNEDLGLILLTRSPRQLVEAVRFLTAAVALRPRSPGCLNNLGIALADRGEVDEAMACFRKAIALDPSYAGAHNNLGLQLKKKGQPDEAIACYRRAVKAAPTLAAPHFNLGSALLQRGRVDEAITCCKKAIELDPKDANAHNNLGNALFRKGQVDEAIANFRKATAIDPKYAPAHSNLGEALRLKGQFDEAIASGRKATLLDPKLAPAHNTLGVALAAKGEVDAGIACLRKAIELDPRSAEAHSNLGAFLCDHKRDYDGAIACFQRAIALDPENPLNHFNLGNALSGKDRVEEAIACYKKAILLDPKFAKPHYKLAMALSGKGQVEEAIACLRKVLAIDPMHAEAHSNLGAILCDFKRDFDGAIRSFKKAIELNPKDAVAHYYLGNALYGKGQLNEAIACYLKAIVLDPRYANAHGNLGGALLDKGKVDEAIACQRKAIELDPKSAKAHYNLGNALKSRGQVDEAIACYKQAIEIDPKYADSHCNLGSALASQGHFAESLAAYQRGHKLGMKKPGWGYPSAVWVRQAERMAALEAKLLAFQMGAYQPKGNAERQGLVLVCHAKKFHHAATGLYAQAFAADVKLVADARTGLRYEAACQAALASAGQGEDAAKLDARERARLRKQALDWLRADLTLLAAGEVGRSEVARILGFWQKDRRLASIRAKAALENLPADERAAYVKLWADVAALPKKAETRTKKDSK
jgi:serine/threonine-protein kinase